MQGIFSNETDPAFNLAAEEYLLKNKHEAIFFLYINNSSIIVGKHQNTLAEIDLQYTLKNNIPVYRRLSGGGTVYHDAGNLNFSFITNEKQGSLIDFDKHSTPIVKALESLGLNVEVGKRHDISISDKKITGTASHVFKNRAMHHGTLLFSANLHILNKCLTSNYDRFKSKGVKSVRSSVTNISDNLAQQMTMQEFSSYIFEFLLSFYPNAEVLRFSKKELTEIKLLQKEKYENWKWNYGYSPVYEFTRSVLIDNIPVTSAIKVEKGIIKNISFYSQDPKQQLQLNKLSSSLTEIQHNISEVKTILQANQIFMEKNKLLNLLF